LIPEDSRSRPERRVVDDDLWQDPEFRKKYESWATEITVGPSETQTTQLRLIAAEEMK
jgi:hypothetical protein